MKQEIRKDYKKRFFFLETEFNRKLFKSISHNLNYPKDFRWKAELKLSSLPKRSSQSQAFRRCLLTGRSRFIVRGFNLSRFMIRKCAQQGFLPGIRKACW